ncbi:MAG: glycosyltransferase family 2 protein [Planctomycetota bacterium]
MAPTPEILALANETTAVICCYNGERYLRDLIESIERQTARPAKLIIVDNASTDASREIVKSEFPDALLVTLAKNDGPCPARNRGLEVAKTKYVFAVDCDVILRDDAIEKLLIAFLNNSTNHNELAAAEPRAVAEEDPALVQYDGAFFHYVGLLILRNFYVPAARAARPAIVEIDAFVSVALLADRECLLSAGGFDPAFFILFEDSDLSYRLRSSGKKIVSVEDSIVIHRGGTAGTSFRAGLYPARRVFLHSRNRWLFLIKNYQFSTLLLGLPGLILYELAAVVFAIMKFSPHAYVHGKLSFFYHLPAALAARRITKTRRRVRDREFVRGGPLTLWPPLTAGRGTLVFSKILDGSLRFFWTLTGGRS